MVSSLFIFVSWDSGGRYSVTLNETSFLWSQEPGGRRPSPPPFSSLIASLCMLSSVQPGPCEVVFVSLIVFLHHACFKVAIFASTLEMPFLHFRDHVCNSEEVVSLLFPPNAFPIMCLKVIWVFEIWTIDLHAVVKNLFLRELKHMMKSLNYGFWQSHLLQALATLWWVRTGTWAGKWWVARWWFGVNPGISPSKTWLFLSSACAWRARGCSERTGSYPTSKNYLWPLMTWWMWVWSSSAMDRRSKDTPGMGILCELANFRLCDLWSLSPQWQMMVPHLGHVDSSLEIIGRDARGVRPSILSAWTPALLPGVVAAWHEIISIIILR